MKNTTQRVNINGKTYAIASLERAHSTVFAYTFPKHLHHLVENKRVYGETLAEIKENILLEESKIRNKLSYQRPDSNLLSDVMEYYFKIELIHRNPRDFESTIQAFRNAVKGSEIDKDIKTLTSDDLTKYFKRIVYIYHLEKVLLIYETLKKAVDFFLLEKIAYINLDDVVLPEKDTLFISNYIPTPKELDDLVNALNGRRTNYYSPIKYLIEFMIMTGIKSSILLNVKPEDFNLAEKTLSLRYGSRECVFELKDEWIDWLKAVEEKGGIRITRYTNSPDETAFFNENGTNISSTNARNFLIHVLLINGLPDGITLASIHKGVIVKLYDSGVSEQELKRKYFLRYRQQVKDFKSEYQAQRLLFGINKE